MLQNIKSKRITAWIALIAVVCVMLFSVFFISQHADHECTGTECPICAVMEQCGNNIKNIGTIIVAIVVAFFLCVSSQKSVQFVFAVCPDYSLISQKIRMNN
ncbi:MAG: AraC family transcriptional regulator [Lachnospiraceae bacterium]|nr:AraC family transcriptional regulator [Candidatus Colinaster equi]